MHNNKNLRVKIRKYYDLTNKIAYEWSNIADLKKEQKELIEKIIQEFEEELKKLSK